MGLFRAIIVLVIYYFMYGFIKQLEEKMPNLPSVITDNKYHFCFLMIFIFELIF
jgi:hypothetical protein